MLSYFFIDRPVFATVLSLVVTLAGGVALVNLPMTQYPPITPPNITVVASYPGASAQVVADAVAAPIEQEVNGVENMMYMSSNSANDGSYSLTVTFKPGTNLDFAQVLVQNRVNLALPLLPDVVRQAGVTTRKRNPDMLMVINLYSPTGEYDQLHLSNYSSIYVREELARVKGVGDVGLFGSLDYSMRVWVDPDRLASMGITAGDVLSAIREQNQPFAAGQVGQSPVPDGQTFEFPLHVRGRQSTPEEFAEIVIRRTADGRQVRIKDIGRVELGAKSVDTSDKLDGRPTANIGVFQLSDANALDVADRVRAKMEELKEAFPPGIDYTIANDSTPFIRESVRGVVKTLLEAIALVAVVVLLFLQSWRAALVPLAAVPVAIVGTFAAMAALGFTLNTLTLFGLVLAIGIVVDDAIVVVEAVQHKIEHGQAPREATRQAMAEVSGPVVATGLVLVAVFVPCAFLGGITGLFFRQFAVTIAVSTALSALNSLTLSPAMCAILLQPAGARKDIPARVLDFLFGWFFRLFNTGVVRSTGLYARGVGLSVRVAPLVLVAYLGLVGLTWWGSEQLPTGYIPSQDQGRMMCSIQLPDAAALERTQEVVDEVSRIARETPGVAHTVAVSGRSLPLGANGSNYGTMLVTLDPIDERTHPSRSANAISASLRKAFAQLPDAQVTVMAPPAVPGLGSAGGFKVMVEDRSGENDPVRLQGNTQRLIAEARKDPQLAGVFSAFRADAPQLYVDVNRQQCQTMGVPVGDVFATQQAFLGSRYVNDFNRFGRTWQVIVQAEGPFRNSIDDAKRIRVRNDQGGMVPLGAVLDIREVAGPLVITRYNMHPAAAVMGSTAPGVSSGDGITAIDRLASRVFPEGTAHEWTEINYIQIDAGKNIWNKLIFPLAVLFVFLVLAAQYESWALPLAVIPIVPLCVLSSLAGVAVAGSDINVFTQIGFVVLIGLACKNAVLIVEFARALRAAGNSPRTAVVEACRLRLRPIVMTSVAFILGVVPLVFATGSGAEMRRALGTAVFAGMIGVTVFGLPLTPVFFVAVEWCAEGRAFQAPWLKRLGRGGLDLIRLRPLRALGRVAVRAVTSCMNAAPQARRRTEAQEIEVTEPNGTGAVAPTDHSEVAS
ncbi:multidrug efflux RND transporter permease subunit [Gemmata sp. JC717]|uniref:efflux RND transporter permease subunit n=1 Tax=Gemmata algarum TaxID=2975278 RepID=UPI0021BACDBA|nr:multidrug efflux RND transporter permease subunit [Gemmata algarum]MDY3555003.1 multidrug efflux RND transporter permease subunit [Gemmata algarum]